MQRNRIVRRYAVSARPRMDERVLPQWTAPPLGANASASFLSGDAEPALSLRRLMSEGGVTAVGSDEPVVGSSEVRTGGSEP